MRNYKNLYAFAIRAAPIFRDSQIQRRTKREKLSNKNPILQNPA